MNIITDRPIYSNVEGETKLKPLGTTEIPSKSVLTTKPTEMFLMLLQMHLIKKDLTNKLLPFSQNW